MSHSPVMPNNQVKLAPEPAVDYPSDWFEQMDGFLTMAENMARSSPGSGVEKAQAYALCAIGKALVRLCMERDK